MYNIKVDLNCQVKNMETTRCSTQHYHIKKCSSHSELAIHCLEDIKYET